MLGTSRYQRICTEQQLGGQPSILPPTHPRLRSPRTFLSSFRVVTTSGMSTKSKALRRVAVTARAFARVAFTQLSDARGGAVVESPMTTCSRVFLASNSSIHPRRRGKGRPQGLLKVCNRSREHHRFYSMAYTSPNDLTNTYRVQSPDAPLDARPTCNQSSRRLRVYEAEVSPSLTGA